MKKGFLFTILLTLCAAFCVGCVQEPTPTHPAGTITVPFTEETDSYPGVDLVVVEGTVTPSSAEIRLINETGFGMSCYGDNQIILHKEQDGTWYEMRQNPIPVTCPGPWGFSADEEFHDDVYWEAFYGVLTPGHYRIVKSCTVKADDGYVTLWLTAEFYIE